jgi:hypothetical protein
MTNDEKNTSYEILLHIKNVTKLLNDIAVELLKRAESHDRSKLEEPELSTFVKFTPNLASRTYGSAEYMQNLKIMEPALMHHYAFNRHHPEYFQEEAEATFRGSPIDCMTLVDIVEMLCDWKASTLRHNDGDIQKSLEINKIRFGLSEQLVAILQNTVKMWEEIHEDQ